MSKLTPLSYKTLDAFDPLIESGAVTLISARWLVKFAQETHGELLPNRQEMEAKHPGALITQETWVQVKDSDKARPAVVSYPWLSATHPDPDRWHLKRLAPLLEVMLQELDERETAIAGLNPFQKANPFARNAVVGDVYVFWDYMSLYQRPRTPEQDKKFREALSCMDLWYAHAFTTVLVLSDLSPNAANPLTYQERGWCTFEMQVYCLASKESDRLRVNTQQGPERLTAANAAAKGLNCVPLTPEDFRTLVRKKTFTNNADCETVADLYEGLFHRLAGTHHKYNLRNRVADADAHLVARYFAQCNLVEMPDHDMRSIDLRDNPKLTDIGLALIVKAIVGHNTPTAVNKTSLYACGGNLSSLLALAFIPRRDTHSSFAIPYRPPNEEGYLREDARVQGSMWASIDTNRDNHQGVCALQHVLGRDFSTYDEEGCRGEREKRLQPGVGPRQGVAEKKMEGGLYVGGVDRHGQPLGFAKLHTPDGQCSYDFWLNGQPLTPPITHEQIADLERAVCVDLVARGEISQADMDMLVGKGSNTHNDTPADAHQEGSDTHHTAQGAPQDATGQNDRHILEKQGTAVETGCCSVM